MPLRTKLDPWLDTDDARSCRTEPVVVHDDAGAMIYDATRVHQIAVRDYASKLNRPARLDDPHSNGVRTPRLILEQLLEDRKVS